MYKRGFFVFICQCCTHLQVVSNNPDENETDNLLLLTRATAEDQQGDVDSFNPHETSTCALLLKLLQDIAWIHLAELRRYSIRECNQPVPTHAIYLDQCWQVNGRGADQAPDA